jgi:predicted dehydrogenase
MNDTTVNIGIIGSGFIARTHAHSLTRFLHHARFAGVAGGSRAPQLAADFSARRFATPEELVSSSEIDAVIIATPHHLHTAHALLAAAHGKHALIEKPMATSVDDCRKIIDAFNAGRRLTLMTAFTQRFRLINKTAYDFIQSGALGRILMIQEQALIANGSGAYPAWQQMPENLGILFGYGIHNIDKLRWFLNDEPSFVAARVNRNMHGIETSTMATIRWTKGALANLWSSVDIPLPGFAGTSYRSLIVGENGLLDVDGYGALKSLTDGQDWQTQCIQAPIDWRGDGMFSEVRMSSFNTQNQHYVDSIINGTDPLITGYDGMRAVEIALDIYHAAETPGIHT